VTTPEKILKSLKKTVENLATTSDSAWTPETVGELDDICGTITKYLGRHHENEPPVDNEALQSFNKFYVYREKHNQIALLAPVDVFQAIRSVQSKTFGFIRKKGQDFPLKYAISGPTRCLKDDPKVLDNEEWTRLSLGFGKGKNFDSNSSGWEHYRGAEKGTDFASHIERLLMLWFAEKTLREFEPDDMPVEKLLNGLHNLRKIRSPVTAEILLNREPCKNCRDFQEMLELVSGLKFKVTVIPTLGNLALKRNEKGRAFFPIKPTKALEIHEDEEDYAIQVRTTSTSKCQVVIPVRSDGPSIKPAASKPSKHHHKSHQHDEESSIISVKTHITIGKSKRLLQSYAYQMSSANLEAGRQRAQFLEESEGNDDEDFVPRTPVKLLDSQTRKSTRFGLATPNTTPLFAPEAHLAADKIKEKRKRHLRERESSPSSGRKHKRNRKE
jgi:hypothetical protein